VNFTVLRFETLNSTNTEAANQAKRGAAEGLCVIADAQTGGKGRQGRTWISEKGDGLYLSIVLRPRLDPAHLSLITLAAAVAVYDVLLKGFLLEPDIKWPNDIHIHGKKICGILAEAVETPTGSAVVLGIGVNLKKPPTDAATSIDSESQFKVTRDELLEAVLDEFEKQYEILHRDPAETISSWTERSSYAHGASVAVTLPSGVIHGTTDGLEETGALRVKLPDGSLAIVHAGDVERLRSEANI
jgi:BirA family transcriptional regulator, biotin operon repressor / biotin---[acetyl-CoA-carboxylase] ligase